MTYFVMLLVLAGLAQGSGSMGREAEEFIKGANSTLLELSNRAGRAAWVQATYITDDTLALSAEAQDRLIERRHV